MADIRAYRVLVAFDAEKNAYTARVPELDVAVSAATRAEAIAEVEQALEQCQAASGAENSPLPPPVDGVAPPEALSLKIAPDVYRELLHHARASGMSPEAYAGQTLARALGVLEGARGARRRAENGDSNEARSRAPRDDRGPERGNERARGGDDRGRGGNDRGRGGDDRGHGRRREGYRPELEDKASFLEYLRGLEKGGQGGGGRGRR